MSYFYIFILSIDIYFVISYGAICVIQIIIMQGCPSSVVSIILWLQNGR